MVNPPRALSILALAAGAVALSPAAGHAAPRTQILRFFDKPVSMTLTHADGTVVTRPPFPEVQPGDTLDVNSLDYRGTHARHSKRFVASTHLRCVFAPASRRASRTWRSAARCWCSPAARGR